MSTDESVVMQCLFRSAALMLGVSCRQSASGTRRFM